MIRIICWFRTFWRTFIYPATWEIGGSCCGHDWVEKEKHENVTVEIDECEVCGKREIVWW